MTVSVIIPAYNEEKYIGTCLTSLTKQSVLPNEVIIVDNNCRDKTVDIAKNYRMVRIVKESHQGIIHARNRGFDEAKGEILARCDADTILPPDWIEKIKAYFAREKVDACSCMIEFYDLPLKGRFFTNLYFAVMKWLQKGHPTLSGPNMVIRRSLWKKVRKSLCLTDNEVHEDTDLAIHVVNIGGKVTNDPDMVVQVSGRRIMNNPWSFFIEYPWRLFKTLRKHL